jgi:hypothetical protein
MASAPPEPPPVDSPLEFKPIQEKGEGLDDYEKIVASAQLKKKIDKSAVDKSASDMPKRMENIEPKAEVDIADVLRATFNPAESPCQIPAGLVRRISNPKNFAPHGLNAVLKKMPSKAIRTSGANIAIFLHTVNLVEDGKQENIPITGSETYNTLDPLPFMDIGRDNFIYSLDCSGFFNAVLAVTGGFSLLGGDLKSSAQAAMNNKNTMVVTRASLFSPVAIALDPATVNPDVRKALPPPQRLGLLFALNDALSSGVGDKATISVPHIVDVMWVSKINGSSFQGEASISASSGISFGFGSVSAKGGSGITVSRSLTSTSFETYLLNAQLISKPARISVLELRTLIEKLGASMLQGARVSRNDKSFVIETDLPQTLCDLPQWSVGDAKGQRIKGDFVPNRGCTLSIPVAAIKQSSIKVTGQHKTLKIQEDIILPGVTEAPVANP